MRPLKFRQMINGRFHYWGFLEKDCFVGPANPSDPSQQFTGLSDRNGKEIYEGDVVCTSLLIPGEVKWGDDIACFEVVHSLGSRGLFGYIKEGSGVLVIGNVHENPDLLKC